MLGLSLVLSHVGSRCGALPAGVGPKGRDLGAGTVKHRPTAGQGITHVGEPISKPRQRAAQGTQGHPAHQGPSTKPPRIARCARLDHVLVRDALYWHLGVGVRELFNQVLLPSAKLRQLLCGSHGSGLSSGDYFGRGFGVRVAYPGGFTRDVLAVVGWGGFGHRWVRVRPWRCRRYQACPGPW